MSTNKKAYLALAYVCFIWGTTYMAIRIGVMHYPPFLFAGTRQAISGLILGGFALYMNKNVDFSLKNLSVQALIGFLMLTMSNGMVTYGEITVPSGAAALICSLMPIFAVLFNLAGPKKEKVNTNILLGLALGTVGVILIFRQNLADLSNPGYITGMLAILSANATWALGSIINRKNTKAQNPMLNSGLQLFFGGVFMLIISPAVDDYSHLEVNRDGLIALVYLIIFGSVLAYGLYMYSLQHLPVSVATIYAYINPLVAVILGYFLMSEPLNWYTFFAFIAILTSVLLVKKGNNKKQKSST